MAWFAHLLATALLMVLVLHLAAQPDARGWHKAVLGAAIVGLALYAFRASDPPAGYLYSDFRIAYYPAGRAVLEDVGGLAPLFEKGVTGFVNLPAVAWLFAPLALLPERTAALVFTAFGAAAIVAAWWLLCRAARLGVRERWLLALLFAANGPLVYSLKEGNTSHLVLLGLAAALVLLHGGRNFAAGAVLAACAVVKPPLALFGLYFLLRRDLRGLAGFAACGAAFAAASVALAGWTLNLRWLELALLKFNREWLAAYNVQSLPAFVLRLDPAVQPLLHDWAALPEVGRGERLAGQVLRTLVLLAAAFACWRSVAGPAQVTQGVLGVQSARGHDPRPDLQFLLVPCFALVASPLSWSHYYAWLLVPMAFLLGRRGLGESRRAWILGWVAILLLTPLVRPFFPAAGWLQDLYRAVGMSHLLFGGLLVFGLVVARLAQGSGLEPGLAGEGGDAAGRPPPQPAGQGWHSPA